MSASESAAGGAVRGPGGPSGPEGQAGGGGRAVARAVLVFAALGLLWAGYWFFFLRPVESTDDAYVVGNQIRVVPRTSGTVLEIFADDTDVVAAGELLVRLDPADALLALERARSELAQAARAVGGQLAQRERLQALIEARERELKLVDDEWRRRRKLKTGSSVTAEELERYRNQTAVAEAVLQAARSELEAAERLLGAGPPAEHPSVVLAAVKLKEAWLAVKRCEIRSPAAGRVARRAVQVGAQAAPGTPLMAVVPEEEIWVEANYKESQLGRIKPGHKAVVRADMYGGAVEYEGVVIGLAAGAGGVFSLLPPENASGNWIKIVQRVPVRIALSPDDLARAPLLLGLSLRVKVAVLEAPVPPPASAEGPVYRLAAAGESAEAVVEAEGLVAEIVAANLEAGRTADSAARPSEAGS
ncbi:MAG: HlyD family efflux transporter periplasmic adaptor subunit [Deltaproteobacteria bacterium]|nr:HlyD family efflux transporter periplasmic adaptor subunit [Deltaproteobacteria bacterium]